MCSYPTNEEIQKGSYKMTQEERWKAFQAKSLLHTKKYTSRTEAAKKGSPEKVSNELNEADVLILSQGWESMSEAQKDQFLGTLRTLFYKTKEKIPK